MFLTTHSPAFYGLCEVDSSVSSARYYVKKSDDGSSIEDSISSRAISNLDRQLGLLPLVEPHIREAVEEARQLRENLLDAQKYLPHPSETSIFVEGLTDLTVISALLAGRIAPHQIKSTPSGGANWVADCLLATVALGDKVGHSIGVLDGDRAGEEASERVNKLAPMLRKVPDNISKVRLARLKPGAALLELRSCKLKVPIALEELASDGAWRQAEANGWLEERPDILEYNEWKDPNKSFFAHCADLGLSVEAFRILKYRVALSYKEVFAAFVRSEIAGTDSMLEGGLLELRKALETALGEVRQKKGHA